MAKKFFYNKVYSTKKLVINIIVIAFCIIGIILCFVFTSHFQGKSNNFGQLDLKTEVIVDINQEFSKNVFFTRVDNVDLEKIDIKYPENYDITKIGEYDVTVVIEGTDYNTKLIVVDTEKPELTLKELTIMENDKYSAKDFVTNCSDNSKLDCIIEFYTDGVNEDGERVDYSIYKSTGTYPIKISAKDGSGNITTKETYLIISKNNKPVDIKPTSSCKFGNDIYDKENYVMAVKVATNGCAVSIDLWKDAGKYELDQITNTEITKIKKELKFLNGQPAITRKIIAILNESGQGIVGYELKFIVTITNDEKTDTVLEYRIDENGYRIYSDKKEL